MASESSVGLGVGLFAFLFIAGIIIALIGFDYVTAGNVGVKDKLGEVSEIPLPSGVYWTGLLTKTVLFDTRVQLAEYESSSASKDLQDVNTKVAVNYRIDPAKAAEIYRTLGIHFQDTIISPIVQESVKSVTAKYNADSLIGERAKVKNDISDLITAKLKDKGLIVTEVSITNFAFSSQFNQAIESKVTQEQASLQARHKLDQVKTEAEQKIAQAQAEAESLRIQQDQLRNNKEILELRLIEKWNGVLPTYVCDGSTSPLMTIPMGMAGSVN